MSETSRLRSRFAAAEKTYSEILDIDPHDATAHLGLAIVKLRGNDLEACVASLHEVSNVLLQCFKNCVVKHFTSSPGPRDQPTRHDGDDLTQCSSGGICQLIFGAHRSSRISGTGRSNRYSRGIAATQPRPKSIEQVPQSDSIRRRGVAPFRRE